MTGDEREAFDDPAMSELMRAWGDAVTRGEARFTPPPDLLRRVADGAEPAPNAADEAPRASRGWRAGWLTLAAAALLAALLWWRGGEPAAPPLLASVQLSTEPTPVRDGGSDTFRSGDRLFVHFRAEGPGLALLVRVDPTLGLSTPLGEPVAVTPGPNTLGPLALDERTGLEALVLLTRAGDRAALRALVDGAPASPPSGDLGERLRSLLEAWRSDPAVAAVEIVFDHRPR